MSEHTKGPWVARGRYIKQDFTFIGIGEDSGCLIASVQGGDTSGPYFIQNNDECDANARRIVACVNACEGITTEGLEFSYNKSINPLPNMTTSEQLENKIKDLEHNISSLKEEINELCYEVQEASSRND